MIVVLCKTKQLPGTFHFDNKHVYHIFTYFLFYSDQRIIIRMDLVYKHYKLPSSIGVQMYQNLSYIVIRLYLDCSLYAVVLVP